MKWARRIFLIAAISLAIAGRVVALPVSGPYGTAGGLQKLVLPLDVPSPQLAGAEAKMATGFGEVSHRALRKPRSLQTRDGCVVVHGDLFRTGGCFALFECHVNLPPEQGSNGRAVGLAEWTKGRWKLRGLWKIWTVWRPKEWKPTLEDPIPVRPATEPFKLRDYSGDGVPEVFVAGDTDKYYQLFYLLRFNPKTHGLALLAETMDEPKIVDGYLRLHSHGGRIDAFDNWEFATFAGITLRVKASWMEWVTRNGEGTVYMFARVADREGRERQFEIAQPDDENENGIIYDITSDGLPWAHVVAVMKNPAVRTVENIVVPEEWLFETITGLSRNLYPPYPPRLVRGRLEDHWIVQVTGSEEAVRKLSIKPQR